jgi:UDP-N-acetyl-D-mannosaminuronate dehydrogenase
MSTVHCIPIDPFCPMLKTAEYEMVTRFIPRTGEVSA